MSCNVFPRFKVVIILVATLLIYGCAPTLTPIMKEAYRGDHQGAVSVFHKQQVAMDKLQPGDIMTLCTAYISMFDFDHYNTCISTLRKREFPDKDMAEELYLMQRAQGRFLLGDYRGTISIATQALQGDTKYTGIHLHYYLAMAYARLGMKEQALAQIQPIKEFEIRIFGLVSVANDALDKIRKLYVTHILMAVDDYEQAKQENERPLAEKHISEKILSTILDTFSLQNLAQDTFGQVVNQIKSNAQSDSSELLLEVAYSEWVVPLNVSGTLAFAANDFDAAITIYEEIRRHRNSKYNLFVYADILRNLAISYANVKRNDQAREVLQELLGYVEKVHDSYIANAVDRKIFMAKYADLYKDLHQLATTTHDQSAVCNKIVRYTYNLVPRKMCNM